MSPADILSLYDSEMRINPPTYGAQVTRLPDLTFCVNDMPSSTGGWVLYTHLKDADADEIIRRQIGYYAEKGLDFEWKVYDHDTPRDLKDRLHKFGLESEELEALVALDMEAAPSRLWQPITADVRRIEDPDGIDQVMEVQRGVWNEPSTGLADELKRDLAQGRDRLSVYAVYVDGRPVSCAWVRFHEHRQFADLWGGSTLPEYRGRGLYTSLVSIRAQEAHGRGVRFLTVDASSMSRPILERLGFQFLTFSQPFVWKNRYKAPV